MNSLERVVGALKREAVDHVPVYPIMSGVNRHLVGADYPTWSQNAEVCANGFIRVTEELGLDCMCTLIDLSVEAADFGQKVIYPIDEAGHPDIYDRMLKDLSDYDKITRINPRETPRMKMHIEVCKRLVEAKGNEVPVVAFVFGPLGILSMLRGQAELYMDLYDDPDKVHEAVNLITDVLLDYCDALMDTGIHAVMFDTLFASASIMSKEMWVEFEAEPMRRLANRVRERGGLVMVHNCGLKIYFDAQIESMNPVAISFLHVPDDCKSMEECKAKYGDKIMLIGCVPPTELPQMSTAQLETICKQNIDTFAKGGGFMLATGCEYPANLSLDHAKTMVNIAKTYGKY